MRRPGRRRHAIGLVVGLAVALTGCGQASKGSSRGEVQHLTIVGTDALRFVPADPVVHPGTVVITLVARGTAPHNLDVPSLHTASATVLGGHRTSITLHVRAGQTYNFVCDLHLTEGMVGTLRVTK